MDLDRLADKNDSIRWARNILLNQEDYLILDTETIGLEDKQIVEVAVIDFQKRPIICSLIHPVTQIPLEATAIHRITNNKAFLGLPFTSIYLSLVNLFCSKKILIYNAQFDWAAIQDTCRANGCPPLSDFIYYNVFASCVMLKYAEFYGEYNYYHKNYKWQKLNGGHTAYSDCCKVIDLIVEMASSPIQDFEMEYYELQTHELIYSSPSAQSDQDELDDIPF